MMTFHEFVGAPYDKMTIVAKMLIQAMAIISSTPMYSGMRPDQIFDLLVSQVEEVERKIE